jgi:RimJ/RimL family protein N-acetyltransferase
MRIQIETLFTHDAAGRMVRVNAPGGNPAPRFFLGRTARGVEWRVRDDVGEELARELASACAEEPAGEEYPTPPYGLPKYEAILARVAPVQRRWVGPAYRFPATLPATSGTVAVTQENAEILRPHLEEWLDDPPHLQPMIASLSDGRAVAICGSVRRGQEAHEAGVETALAFRGRGHATRAVSRWAEAVRDMGLIPLYSTSWENIASQAVAQALGLVRYGTDLHIT